MKRGNRAVAIAVMIAAASFVIHADVTPLSQSGEIQLQLAHAFYRDGRYPDALDAYRRALLAVPPDDQRAARAGVVQSALRVAEFDLARVEADALVKSAPQATRGDRRSMPMRCGRPVCSRRPRSSTARC